MLVKGRIEAVLPCVVWLEDADSAIGTHRVVLIGTNRVRFEKRCDDDALGRQTWREVERTWGRWVSILLLELLMEYVRGTYELSDR